MVLPVFCIYIFWGGEECRKRSGSGGGGGERTVYVWNVFYGR